ncbi:MAG TPA: type II toxin-antitoxin system CcdA family antitoxin [Acidiphilium sp.]
MGYDGKAPKRPINVSLNQDLVRQARHFTSNLSGTLEILLRDFVAREQDAQSRQDVSLARVIDGLNGFHQKHDLLSDEFQTL